MIQDEMLWEKAINPRAVVVTATTAFLDLFCFILSLFLELLGLADLTFPFNLLYYVFLNNYPLQLMHCSIVSDHLRQAEFVKKGLYYEHLSCDLYSYDDYDKLQQELPFTDGIFFLFRDISNLQESFELCQNFSGGSTPMVILAQKNSAKLQAFVESKECLLFVRPFSFRRIASEMKMLIFTVKEDLEESSFVVRDLELDLLAHRVRCHEQNLSLRNKEFALLHYLMVHKGKVLSRSEILENVWDRNADILTNTVDVHVSQLRKKIAAFTSENYIHTVPCKGYFLA